MALEKMIGYENRTTKAQEFRISLEQLPNNEITNVIRTIVYMRDNHVVAWKPNKYKAFRSVQDKLEELYGRHINFGRIRAGNYRIFCPCIG